MTTKILSIFIINLIVSFSLYSQINYSISNNNIETIYYGFSNPINIFVEEYKKDKINVSVNNAELIEDNNVISQSSKKYNVILIDNYYTISDTLTNILSDNLNLISLPHCSSIGFENKFGNKPKIRKGVYFNRWIRYKYNPDLEIYTTALIIRYKSKNDWWTFSNMGDDIQCHLLKDNDTIEIKKIGNSNVLSYKVIVNDGQIKIGISKLYKIRKRKKSFVFNYFVSNTFNNKSYYFEERIKYKLFRNVKLILKADMCF